MFSPAIFIREIHYDSNFKFIFTKIAFKEKNDQKKFYLRTKLHLYSKVK